MVVMIFLAFLSIESDLYSILLITTHLLFIFVFVFYIAAIVFTPAAVFLVAKQKKRRLKTEQLPDEEAKRLKANKKAANTLTIILTALLFSYLSVIVLYGSATFSDDVVELRVLYISAAWSCTCGYVCSLLNPLIYCWRMKMLRGALFKKLHLRRVQVSTGVELQTQRSNQQFHPNEA